MDRPYASFIGVRIEREGSASPVCVLVPGPRVAGAPGMLHSGALAGLLEAAAGAIVETVVDDKARQIRPVSITVDYLRRSQLTETRASAEIVRKGENIVHVDATAWQGDCDRPIAMGRLVFLLR